MSSFQSEKSKKKVMACIFHGIEIISVKNDIVIDAQNCWDGGGGEEGNGANVNEAV